MTLTLRKHTVWCDAASETVEICELSATALMEFREALAGENTTDRNVRGAAVLCKHGVVELRDLTVDKVLDTVSAAVLLELSPHIMELSGLDKEADDKRKKSASAPIAVSSTG